MLTGPHGPITTVVGALGGRCDMGLGRDWDRETIAGFAKGLTVIEAFDSDHQKLTISEVAVLTGLQRATARRCLLTLVRTGYASFDGKYYRLTARMLRLGQSFLASNPLPRLVQPYLEQLARDSSEGCAAWVLDGSDAVVVAGAGAEQVTKTRLGIGSRVPAYCCSVGRVLLASLPERERRRLIGSGARHRFTPQTVIDTDALLEAIEAVGHDGYALLDGEYEAGVRGIAVPLVDASGRVVGAFNIGGPADRISPERLRGELLPRMRSVSDELRPLLT